MTHEHVTSNIADMLHGRQLEALSVEEMRELIRSFPRIRRLKPDTYIGSDYFEKILNEKGVIETASLIREVHHIGDTETELNLSDLKRFSAESAFIKTGRKLSSYDFLRTFGFIQYGAEEIVRQSVSLLNKITEGNIPGVRTSLDFINGYVEPTSLTVLGAALVATGFNELHELKLESIANVAAEIAKVAGFQRKRSNDE